MLLLIIVLILVFGFGGPYYYGGPERGLQYGSSGLATVFLILLLLYLLGVLPRGR